MTKKIYHFVSKNPLLAGLLIFGIGPCSFSLVMSLTMEFDFITLVGFWIAFLGGITGFISFLKTCESLETITDPTQISEILPIWFTGRMSWDEWYFGIVTTGGIVWAITSIEGITSDKEWLTVNLTDENFEPQKDMSDFQIITATGDRTTANIKISHIVGTIELAST